MISMDEIENAKENVQPMKHGRSAAALAKQIALADHRGSRDKLIEQQKEYSKWAQETYLSGGDEVKDILKRCIDQFARDPRYRENKHFLMIWIKYADLSTEPLDIFTYMVQNEIGSSQSLRYIAHAAVLELKGDFAGADGVFQSGIQYGAQPLDHLKRYQDEFLKRMVKRIQRQQARDQELGNPVSNTLPGTSSTSSQQHVSDENGSGRAEAVREPLSMMSTKTKVGTARPTTVPSSAPRSMPAIPIARSTGTVASSIASSKNKTFSIFTEDAPSTSVPVTLFPTGRTEVPSEKVDKKENTGIVSQWSNVTVPQKASLKRPPTSDKFEIFNESLPVSKPSASASIPRTGGSSIIPSSSSSQTTTSKFSIFSESSAIAPSESSTTAVVATGTAQPKSILSSLSSASTITAQPALKPMKLFGSGIATGPSVPAVSKPVSSLLSKLGPAIVMAGSQTSQSENVDAMVTSAKLSETVAAKPFNLFGGSAIVADKKPPTLPQASAPAASKMKFAIFSEETPEPFSLAPKTPGNAMALRQKEVSAESDKPISFGLPVTETVNRSSDRSASFDVSESSVIVEEKPAKKEKLSVSAAPVTKEAVVVAPKKLDFDFSSPKSPRQKIQLDDDFTLSTAAWPSFNLKKEDDPMDVAIAMNPSSGVSQGMSRIAIDEDAESGPEDNGEMEEEDKTAKSTAFGDDDTFFNFSERTKLSKFHVHSEELAARNVNPFESGERSKAIQNAKSVLSTCRDYFDHSDEHRSELRRGEILELDGQRYHVRKLIGEGGYANVYLAEDDSERQYALKCQKPSSVWEFYIYKQLYDRLEPSERVLLGQVRQLHMYRTNSVLVMSHGTQGTLQGVINAYMKAGKQGMDELVAAYYTSELLHTLSVVHEARIIHGDMKADNVLLRHATDSEEPLGEYDGTGRNGWSSMGVQLIDFGRSIDCASYPDNTMFVGDSVTQAFRCIEMQTGRSWTYQIDTYGLCDTVHAMLHGKYMEVVQQRNPITQQQRWKTKAPLKRYWNQGLWESFFDSLLNISSCVSQPSLPEMREKFIAFLRPQSRELAMALAREQSMLNE